MSERYGWHAENAEIMLPLMETLSNKLCQTNAYVQRAVVESGLVLVPADEIARLTAENADLRARLEAAEGKVRTLESGLARALRDGPKISDDAMTEYAGLYRRVAVLANKETPDEP